MFRWNSISIWKSFWTRKDYILCIVYWSCPIRDEPSNWTLNWPPVPLGFDRFGVASLPRRPNLEQCLGLVNKVVLTLKVVNLSLLQSPNHSCQWPLSRNQYQDIRSRHSFSKEKFEWLTVFYFLFYFAECC